MNKIIMSILMISLYLTPAAWGCIGSTDIQEIADATGMQYIFWDNIFGYYCDSIDNMTGQIDDNNVTIHKVRDGTNETIDNYLKLNNLTADHYINLSNQTMNSYLRQNNISMNSYLNIYNLTLNHHINVTDQKMRWMNDTLYNISNLTTHLHNITLLQSDDLLDDYRTVSDAADLMIVDQMDSQFSKMRSDKVSYSQLYNLSETIKMDVYKIVNNNRTSPTLYYLLILINLVITVVLIMFMVPRIGGMGAIPQQGTGTDYARPPNTLFKSLIPTKISSIPSIVVTNENIVNQKKRLRDLKYEGLKLAAKNTKEFKAELLKDIDDNLIKDNDELKEHYIKLKLINDEDEKEKSADNPRFRVTKGKDAGQQQALPKHGKA